MSNPIIQRPDLPIGGYTVTPYPTAIVGAATLAGSAYAAQGTLDGINQASIVIGGKLKVTLLETEVVGAAGNRYTLRVTAGAALSDTATFDLTTRLYAVTLDSTATPTYASLKALIDGASLKVSTAYVGGETGTSEVEILHENFAFAGGTSYSGLFRVSLSGDAWLFTGMAVPASDVGSIFCKAEVAQPIRLLLPNWKVYLKRDGGSDVKGSIEFWRIVK